MEPLVVLDLHGTGAREGVDIDAFETFLRHFRGALREQDRAARGSSPRRGGHPDARDVAVTALRLVRFRTGSGVATLAPGTASPGAETALPFDAKPLSIVTLEGLLEAVGERRRISAPVVEALASARRAVGPDGSFGIEIVGGRAPRHRVVIDEAEINRLQDPAVEYTADAIVVIGRLHMIEVDQPRRRIGVRAQTGIDWTCQYADDLHDVVIANLERLVRVEGAGQQNGPQSGQLEITRLTPVDEPEQEPLFTIEPIRVEALATSQRVTGPQGIDNLVDEDWEDDEEGRLFLEATLGPVQPT